MLPLMMREESTVKKVLAQIAASVWLSPLAFALPAGEGESLVREHCSSCHRPEILNRAQGYDTASEWRQLMATMVELDEPRADIIARYLTKHFQSKPELYPTLVEGPVDIEIEEWMVPTLGQRSRDPVEAPDGAIWWTGMWASLVGRLDPLTGAFREYPLPASARPHSIVPDDEGAIWYLGNSNGTVGKLNPLTGEIREYETGLADPHTGVFHPNGYFYFTAQHTGAVARLDPATGEILSVNTYPRPYGIKVGPDGYLYVAFNGENAIGQWIPRRSRSITSPSPTKTPASDGWTSPVTAPFGTSTPVAARSGTSIQKPVRCVNGIHPVAPNLTPTPSP